MPPWLDAPLSLGLLSLLIWLWRRPGPRGPQVAMALLLLACCWGFHWIFTSLHVYGEMAWPIAALATLALAGYVAAYGLLAGWLVRRHQLGPVETAALITWLELLRGHLFTGFAWNGWGYLQVDSPLAGIVPFFGVYGLVFVTALCAAWLASLRWQNLAKLASLHLVCGLLGLISFTQPVGEPLKIALVQGAIDQGNKFDPTRIAQNEGLHLAIAEQASDPQYAPDLVVLPETAFVYPWAVLHPETQLALQGLVNRNEVSLITGIPSLDDRGWWNSAIALAPGEDEPVARYDKHHLVPFGEYIPWGFQWFVALMNMPLGEFQTGAPRQLPFGVGEQRIGINICYEDLFGEEIIRALDPSLPERERPTLLLNLSNLAWFGDSNALPQHLAISRMRALETGRPMLRATNTGVTGLIQPNGKVAQALPVWQQSVLMVRAQGHTGNTPFAHWGNLPAWLLSLGLLGWALRRRLTPRVPPLPAKIGG